MSCRFWAVCVGEVCPKISKRTSKSTEIANRLGGGLASIMAWKHRLEERRATIVAHFAIDNMCRQSLKAANAYSRMTAAHGQTSHPLRILHICEWQSKLLDLVVNLDTSGLMSRRSLDKYGGSLPLGQAIWSIAADTSTIMCPFCPPMRPDRMRISMLGHPVMH